MTERSRMRADVLLVERGLFESRAKAQAAIEAGRVRADGATVRKASDAISAGAAIEAEPAHPYVSRGGVKLAYALERFAISVVGRHALDVGASTGGFVDALLKAGAAHVTAVDVGRGQIHPSIAADSRVLSLEATDIRALDASVMPQAPSIVTLDVSFAPLSAVLPAAVAHVAPNAYAVALVKPQFEVGRAAIGKNGIVKDEDAQNDAVERALALMSLQRFVLLGVVPSPILGGEGNREFLIAGRRYDG